MPPLAPPHTCAAPCMPDRSAAQLDRQLLLASSAASAAICAASMSASLRCLSEGKSHCTRSFLALFEDGMASRTLSKVADIARRRDVGTNSFPVVEDCGVRAALAFPAMAVVVVVAEGVVAGVEGSVPLLVLGQPSSPVVRERVKEGRRACTIRCDERCCKK